MSLSFLPRIMARTVMDLSPQLLQQRGIALLMLDFDNTIVPYTTDEPTEEMLAWLTEMAASGIQICIVSNSKKPRVVTFAKRYGLDVMTHAHKPSAKVLRACMARYGVAPEHAALAGDQIYTDVLGANRAGALPILVQAISNHTIWLKLRHVAEQPFILAAKGRKALCTRI